MKALRWYRERAGMSVSRLSAASGVSRGAISRAEAGEHSPSITTLERMAVPLGITASQVLAAEDVLSERTAEVKRAG